MCHSRLVTYRAEVIIADALSRFQVQRFRKMAPTASQAGFPVPNFFMGDIDRRTYEILAAALSKNTRDIYVRAVNAFMRFGKTRGWAIFGQQVLHK